MTGTYEMYFTAVNQSFQGDLSDYYDVEDQVMARHEMDTLMGI